ncbi:MAG: hypothetical protein QOC55_1140 [Thermoleophilaceae bacterium]|jgi:hypothetical protein|nr:hypothetical protein [Thermoleophilaceae bacterium]
MFTLIATYAVTALAAAGTPSHLSANVDNTWFPLKPGTVLRYRGGDNGTPTKDVFVVTNKTRRVPGGRARIVHDRVFKHGRVAEDTLDWYAQDRAGNVWYFGESTKELDAHGRVTSREGSWQAGRDGAQAGIFMPARPRVGRSFRQEYYKGHADDHFKIVAIKGDLMTTHEWTPIEPGVLDQKVYQRGVGTTSEDSLKGGREHLHLVSVKRG